MILDDIVKYRIKQLERDISECPFDEMKKKAEAVSSPCRGFKTALMKEGISVIAEVKKASPSKGIIEPDFRPAEIAAEYEKAGAAAISCLTEEHYFKGGKDVFEAVRNTVSVPMLRKDFIIDPYQIYEARVMGADAVLLIAAILSDEQLSEYRKIAESLGLDVLSEAHDEEELERNLKAGFSIIGINNRNLKTFEVSLENFNTLSAKIPESYVKVAESGIRDNADMRKLRSYGADAALIGETLMRSGISGVKDCMEKLTEGII